MFWMSTLISFSLVWAAFFFTNLRSKPTRVGKGKLVSKRYARLMRRFPLVSAWVVPFIFGWQLMASLVSYPLCTVPVLFFIVMALDDFFTGDDRIKKRFFAFKNKVKWLMELPPEPIPVRVR
jgi:hypothetical protein